MTPRANPRGFTLIEVLLGLAILALLLLLGLPSFTTFLRNSEVRSTAESIVNGLRAAAAEAANKNTRVTFTLAGAGSADWTITWVDDGGVTQTIQQYSGREAGSNTSVTIGQGANTVTFNELGRIRNPGTDDHIRFINIEPIVSGQARPLRIIVDDPTRGLRLCDPDPALAALGDPRAC